MFSIVAGCDYFKLPGIGPGKAAAIVRSLVNSDNLTPAAVLQKALEKVKGLTRQQEPHYTGLFEGAEHAFSHAVVYDPRTRTERTLSGVAIPSGADAYVGTLESDNVHATDSALGFVPVKLVAGMEVFVRSGKKSPSECKNGTDGC